MCKALISPARRDRAAASAAAPSDSKITIAGVLAASCAVNTIPAGVASSRASSQNSPTFGGSAASSGVTGTYPECESDAPSKTRSAASGVGHPGSGDGESGAHGGSGGGAGGSAGDITLHLAASIGRG
jgi:hypothetical protein